MRKWMLLPCILFLYCTNDVVDCSLAIPPDSTFLLKYEDMDGNSLIGNIYLQDSFKLRSLNSTIYLKPRPFSVEDQLAVWLNDIINNEIYYLELSETDTDTLQIEHSLVETNCFSYSVLESFKYNNELLYEIGELEFGGLFVIIKD